MELTSLGYPDSVAEGVEEKVQTNEMVWSCEAAMAGTNDFTSPSLHISLEYTSLAFYSMLLS